MISADHILQRSAAERNEHIEIVVDHVVHGGVTGLSMAGL